MNKSLATLGAISVLSLGGFAVDQNINPYTDKGKTLEMVQTVSLPDAKESKVTVSKDEPKVNLSKWGGEVNMGVKYEKVKAKGNRKLLSNKVEWKGNKESVEAYPLAPQAGMEDGGFEIEVILDEIPDSNVFDFKIEGAEDLDFFYQPPLTQGEIDEGTVRPENVIGSYAVYHKTKKNHKVGDTNYATGKVYHIYRPKVIDANGDEVWADLLYQQLTDTLTVTVPQSFLDNAVYPVRVDPTFGYTTIGATQNLSVLAEDALLAIYSLTEDGTVTKLTIYTKSSTDNAKGLIYDDDGASAYPGTLMGISDIVAVPTTFDWYDFAFGTPVDLTTGDWWLGFAAGGTSVFEAFDAGGVNQQRYLTSASAYTTPPDPFTAGATGSNRNVSIYATYTADAPAVTPETPINSIRDGSVIIRDGNMIIRNND